MTSTSASGSTRKNLVHQAGQVFNLVVSGQGDERAEVMKINHGDTKARRSKICHW